MKVTAVIPCFNGEATIADIVRRTQKYVDNVIVVDNMSTDNSIEEAEKDTLYNNVKRCYVRGAGATTALGIAYAQNPIPHLFADVIVTLDCDGQHDPDEIPVLLKPLELDCADVVIGSRFLGDYKVRRFRKAGIDVITWLLNVGHGNKLVDGQSCFRAFTREVAKQIRITERGFGFSTEFLIKARLKRFRIIEVPISCIYHEEKARDSSQNEITHGVGAALKTIKWRFHEELMH